MILDKLCTMEKVLPLMKKDSIIKEYSQFMKIYKFSREGEIFHLDFEKIINKIVYIYEEKGIEHIQVTENVETFNTFKNWLVRFLHNNENYIAMKITYRKKEDDFDERKIKNVGRKISKKYKEYQFEIYYETYLENLLLANGILEERKICYIVLNMDKNGERIRSFFYTEYPRLEDIYRDIEAFLKIEVRENILEKIVQRYIEENKISNKDDYKELFYRMIDLDILVDA